jgi:DNA-binding response OmpR family regulator
LLVCAESCDAVEKCLTSAGCVVTKVCDGDRALNRMRREIFDTAVVVSTGKEMDLAETVFNLRDIRSSMEIVIVAGCADASRDVIGEIAATVPKVSMFTITEFQTHLDSIAGREKWTARTR